MTDLFTAAWALTDSVLIRTLALVAALVGLTMLAAAWAAHRPTTYGPRALYGPLDADTETKEQTW